MSADRPALRVCIVGLGVVGKWVLSALERQRATASTDLDFDFRLVAVANARDGLIYGPDGLDPGSILRELRAERPLGDQRGAARWPTAQEGLREIEADVLVEVSSSPPPEGEPGCTHIREALERGMAIATSNKWPIALHGVELAARARELGLPFRAESTVMSGTPVLSTLTSGIAGASPTGVRGVLNATVNYVVSEVAKGRTYDEAVTEAQAIGLAERDPSADLDGHDETAKVMVLAGLVFGVQLARTDVACRGVARLTDGETEAARSREGQLRSVTTLVVDDRQGTLSARIEPTLLPPHDPLAGIEGAQNAIVCAAEPLGEITLVGPGAGPELAGQGVFSDLIAIGRAVADRRPGWRIATPAMARTDSG
jgi:homoserine dehydrogenase